MQHKEAFALMLYRNEKTGREEWIWNSRDGVTPFIVPDAEDGGEMRHVDWFRDVAAPFYVPPVGSRIFVNLTETRARALAAQWLEHVDGPDFREHEYFKGRPDEEILAEKVRDMMDFGGGGSPDILVVNAAMQADFRARQPQRAPRFGGGRFA